MTTRRVPSGAAVLRPEMTAAITEAVLDELAEQGFSRLSMEAVAKRAGVGKSALYRRWASKQDMALAVIAEFSVAKATFPDTGSLRGDMRAALDALMDWLTHPRFSRILPDLVAEMARNPELAALVESMTGGPRREQAAAMFQRAIERGELHPDVDMELALDLLAAPLYWRLVVRAVDVGPGYLDAVTAMMCRALGA
ncbi:TetR/AcrR family transcriptional regulator [Mycolicibacterium sp. CR10]|uniref:TetR/AcrR family transcriptional regulator n=1 Tax=Mycolicibacterium sp. CR10 TaxID=2562314 RepID=UPI0010BFE4EC|nr:TetR/AcrR family transcriptional regulator [Mycolicibacterium sp. CR10]